MKINNKSLKTSYFIHLALIAAFAVIKTLINVKSAKNLQFIQITRLVEFTPNSSLLAFLLGEASSTQVENVRQITPFYKKQTQFYWGWK
jgi:hypothetical protein